MDTNQATSKINLYTEKTLFTPEVDKELTELCDYLSNIIDSAKKQAELAKKPLLILIGENHCSINSLVIESLIIDIAVKKLSIKEVFTEAEIMGFHDTLSVIGETLPAISIQKKLNSMGITQTAIDIPKSFWKRTFPLALPLAIFDLLGKPFGLESGLLSEISYRLSEEGVKDRNTHMAKNSIKTELSDKIGIVGAYHLFGLIKETELTDHYYVLPINTCETDLKHPLDYFIEADKFMGNSEEVVQIHAKNLDKTWAPSFMTKNMQLNRLNTLHERHLNTVKSPCITLSQHTL